jgi:hypothetical protein
MSSRLLIASLLVLFAVGWSDVSAVDMPNMQVRIYIDTKAQYLQLRSLHLDQVWEEKNYIEILTDSTELFQLQALGYRTETVIADFGAFSRARLATKDMGGYKTLSEIYDYIDLLILFYPGLVSEKVSIGQTIEGRPTWAVKISDNPNIDEDEIEILYTAAIHAREVITPEVLFYYMDYLLGNYGVDPQVTYLVDNREMWFVPVVNPDGYFYNQVIAPSGGGLWRKNRRNNGDGSFGVDLNRNFGHAWGYDDIGSSPDGSQNTYRGTGPFSEPETQNIRDFIIAHNFLITVYYHSYSNLVLWPWGYIRSVTPDNDIFAQMGDSIAAYNGYDPGPSWSLYLVNGDSDDWGYAEQTAKNKNFAITLEVGSYSDNFWPPLNRVPALVSENLQPNLFIARVAERVYQLRAPQAPTLLLADSVDAASYSVDWSHHDTLNPAIQYELMELQNKGRVIDSAKNWNNWLNNGFVFSSTRYHSSNSSYYSGAQSSSVKYFTAQNPILVLPNDTLRFWTFYDIETDFDYGYVEVSLDGISFQPIPGNITTTSNPNGNNRGHGITGASVGWIEASFDLSAFAGNNIFLRFTYETDAYVLEEGMYIDDIYPVESYGIQTLISSSITDTTYQFLNKTDGIYYYRVRAKDAENQWGDFSSIGGTVVGNIVTYVCGDANGNGAVNILDVTAILAYLYKNGPAPEPLEAADANGNGAVNILDATYLIGYLFKSGPEPLCQ